MAICPTHGVHFDEQRHSKCGLCRQNEREDRRASPVLKGLLAVAVFAGLGYAVVRYAGLERLAAPSSQQRSLGFDPEPYRPQIEKLESILYQPVVGTLLDANAIEAAARDLAAAMRAGRTPRSPFGASGRIELFGSDVSGSVEHGYAYVDLGWARGRWEELRREIFAPAPWFAGSAATPPAEVQR